MITEEIKEILKQTLHRQPEIMFAYLHGSILSSVSARDIDAAVFLYPEAYIRLAENGQLSIGLAIPLEMELEKHLSKKVDVQVLNNAPLSFKYRIVTQGLVIVDKDSNPRCDFEYLSRVEYFDFRPRRIEYLQEVMK